MGFRGPKCKFLATEDSRANVTGDGTSITPASGAKGSWTAVGSALANDCYGIFLGFVGQSLTNQDNTFLVDVGVDPAGGTAFVTLIPNLLVEGPASAGTSGNAYFLPSFSYFFPIFIKAGSSIGMRAQIKGATLNTFFGHWRTLAKPTAPELWRTGSFVDAVGVDAVNTKGTTLTNGSPDNTTYGAWTSLGTAPRDSWWLQGGMNTVNVANNNNAIVEFSVGNQPTSPSPLLLECSWSSAAAGSDRHTTRPWSDALSDVKCPAGTSIYGRFRQATSNTVTLCAAAYLLG